MRILNLYAGVGGNRKLWGDGHDVTAIENVDYIADAYQKLYSNDRVIKTDAHNYLEAYFASYDFIWSSPPCPTHSRMRTSFTKTDAVYPDMRLYEEIIFLQTYFKGTWIVENVIPYYKPLIQPAAEIDRHLFWSNVHIPRLISGRDFKGRVTDASKETLAASHDIQLPEGTKNQRKLLRNAVDPQLGLHLFQAVGLQKRVELSGEQLGFSKLAPKAKEISNE